LHAFGDFDYIYLEMISFSLRKSLIVSFGLHVILILVLAFIFKTDKSHRAGSIIRFGVFEVVGKYGEPKDKDNPLLSVKSAVKDVGPKRRNLKQDANLHEEVRKEEKKGRTTGEKDTVEGVKISTAGNGKEISGKRGGSVSKDSTGTRQGEPSNSLGIASLSNYELAYPDYKVNPKPHYPYVARRRGYEGIVVLKVLVMEDGRVGEIRIEESSGFEILDEAAIKSVRKWVFSPAKRNGIPVSSWVKIPIRFELNEAG
jgi:TonB family protein